MCDAAEVRARLEAERVQVGRQGRRWRRAAARPRRARRPRTRRRRRRPRAGRAGAASAIARNGSVSTAVCERMPIARPASSAPAISVPAGRLSRRPAPASTSTAAKPEHVAERTQRREPEQRRGRQRRASPTAPGRRALRGAGRTGTRRESPPRRRARSRSPARAAPRRPRRRRAASRSTAFASAMKTG